MAGCRRQDDLWLGSYQKLVACGGCRSDVDPDFILLLLVTYVNGRGERICKRASAHGYHVDAQIPSRQNQVAALDRASRSETPEAETGEDRHQAEAKLGD